VYPADGNQWGEAHPLVQPRANGTQAEFEDGSKDCLALLGRQGTTRQDEERVKAEKATPVFAEHVLIDLISVLQKKTGHQVFPVQINNAQCATKMYDFPRRNKLPLTPHHLTPLPLTPRQTRGSR
jgi:hypothetical protein